MLANKNGRLVEVLRVKRLPNGKRRIYYADGQIEERNSAILRSEAGVALAHDVTIKLEDGQVARARTKDE